MTKMKIHGQPAQVTASASSARSATPPFPSKNPSAEQIAAGVAEALSTSVVIKSGTNRKIEVQNTEAFTIEKKLPPQAAAAQAVAALTPAATVVPPRPAPKVEAPIVQPKPVLEQVHHAAQAVEQPPSPITSVEHGKSYAEQDADYFRIEVPSNFSFYSFKTVSTRTLKAPQQAKFNRAAQEDNLQHVVDGIGSVLEPGISAYDFTPQDFYFLMYWQRVFSYPKTPLRVTATCKNRDHIERVGRGELEASTLHLEEIVTHTTLKTTYATLGSDFRVEIQKHLSPKALEFWEENQEFLNVETMRDMVEAEKILENTDKDKREELKWFLDYASYLKINDADGKPLPLAARVAFIDNLNPDDMDSFDEYIKVVDGDYGVAESAIIRCRECGATSAQKLPIDAVSFLPNIQRRDLVE